MYKFIISSLLVLSFLGSSYAAGVAFNSRTMKVEWEAYKFTEMAPVKGTFDSFVAIGLGPVNSNEHLFDGVSLLIDTHSVNSGNPPRDQTLVSKFFDLFTGRYIRGYANGFDGKSLDLTLSMNGRKVTRKAKVTQDGNKIMVEATFDMVQDFLLSGAHSSLHKACELLHTGKDGKSVTATEFKVRFYADLMEL